MTGFTPPELVERLRSAAEPKTYRRATRTARTPHDADLFLEAASGIAELTEALRHSRGAIASLPEDALGFSEPQHEEDVTWPLRDEILHMIDSALAKIGGNHG